MDITEKVLEVMRAKGEPHGSPSQMVVGTGMKYQE